MPRNVELTLATLIVLSAAIGCSLMVGVVLETIVTNHNAAQIEATEDTR